MEAGRVAHGLLARVLTSAWPDVGWPQMLPVVLAKLPPVVGQVDPWSRRAVVQRAVAAVGVYLGMLAPPPSARLVGCEVRVDGAAADLVWETAAHSIWVDEIKTGLWSSKGTVTTKVLDQVRRLRTGSAAAWPERYIGVRLCLLAAPARTAWFPASGPAVRIGTDRRLFTSEL